jgi:hypothetical protein
MRIELRTVIAAAILAGLGITVYSASRDSVVPTIETPSSSPAVAQKKPLEEPQLASTSQLRLPTSPSHLQKTQQLMQASAGRVLQARQDDPAVGALRIVGPAAGAEVRKTLVDDYLRQIRKTISVSEVELSQIAEALDRNIRDISATTGRARIEALTQIIQPILGDARSELFVETLRQRQKQLAQQQVERSVQTLDYLELSPSQQLEVSRLLMDLRNADSTGSAENLAEINHQRQTKFQQDIEKLLSPEQRQRFNENQITKQPSSNSAPRSLLF